MEVGKISGVNDPRVELQKNTNDIVELKLFLKRIILKQKEKEINGRSI